MQPLDDITPLPVLVDDFFIDDWHVRPALHRLERPGEAMRVTPKVMHVLCCLAAQPGIVLRRDDLLGTVWHGTIVTDTVLSRAISELRKVFGDAAGDPQVIETIPTTGYRLIAPVRREAAALSASKPARSVEAASIPQTHWLRWMGWSLVGLLVLGGAGALLSRPSGPAGDGVAADLLRAVPLTTTPGREHQPAFSPDGARVVYVWEGDLYIRHVHEGDALRLTDHPAPEASPVWSPDGGAIAFVRYDDDACVLYEVAALGGPERRLASCDPTARMALAWSPDGRTLVFPERLNVEAAAASLPPASLVAFDRQTLGRLVLTTPSEPSHGDSSPVFSPDGRWLAFIRRVDYWADDLYLLGLDADTLRRVTFDARSISGVDWTADGRHLVWGSNRGGAYSLWKIGITQGATPEPLYVTSGGVLNHPRLARQGRRLVYENWSYESNIWRLPGRKAPSETPPALAIGSTMWDLQPAVAPDGQEMAFISTRSGSFELWISRLDGSNARQLTQFEGPFVGMPRWSSDGQRLAFVARTGDAARDVVYVLDRDARVPQALTEAQHNSSVPSWAQDGAALYVGSDRSGTWQVWRLPLDGAVPLPITDNGGAMAFESPDGTTLYYNKRRQAAIWQRPVGGGPETLVVDEATLDFDAWNWLVTDEGFYFFQPHEDGTTAVIFFDRTTRLVTPLAVVEHLGFSPGIAVSPDEASLFYTRADRSEGDLMLVEPFE